MKTMQMRALRAAARGAAPGRQGAAHGHQGMRNVKRMNGQAKGLRACFKISRGPVFGQKAVSGATKVNIPGGSSTEEQRSQTAFCPQTLLPAALLPLPPL